MKRQVVPDDFWDLSKLDLGTIVYDVIRGPSSSSIYGVSLETPIPSIRLIIMRGHMDDELGPAGWCSYIGVPLDSPLAGLPYSHDRISGFECHGRLTFAGPGDEIHRPEGWYYFGWDYAHGGDWTFFSLSGRKWTFGEVKEELGARSLQMQELLASLLNLYSNDVVFPKRTYGRKRLIRVNGAELI